MIRVLRKNLVNVFAIIALIATATGVSVYILQEQRLRFPIFEDEPFRIKAEFATARSVVPGQGQTVRVSGIRVGDIGRVDLVEGRAVVTFDLDQEFKDLVRRDATALLRPKTGLKDMFVELDPGREGPPVQEGFTIPVANTLPDVNPEELFAMLDADTRDYLKLLVHGAGDGLDGRGRELGDVLRRFEPLHRDIAAITRGLARRRQNLRRVVNHLARLNGELARNDERLTAFVRSSAAVFRALAQEEDNIAATLREAPSALGETRVALDRVRSFASVLRPAADELRPAVRALARANEAIPAPSRAITPMLRRDIRPFVREARPLVRELRAPANQVADGTPGLRRTFRQLNRFFNLLTYNEGGKQGPEVADRDEGFLFWLAWLGHQGVNLFSSSDAHGVFRPVAFTGTCQTIESLVGESPLNEFALNLTPILLSDAACGRTQVPLPAMPKTTMSEARELARKQREAGR